MGFLFELLIALLGFILAGLACLWLLVKMVVWFGNVLFAIVTMGRKS
jgi:hypothetical protein